jgi:serine/threonine protein phosphatase PrpC
MKKENQDEYFSQVGSFGGTLSGNCFCIFDGHGSHGAAVSKFCVEQLPLMLDQKLTEHRQKLVSHSRHRKQDDNTTSRSASAFPQLCLMTPHHA